MYLPNAEKYLNFQSLLKDRITLLVRNFAHTYCLQILYFPSAASHLLNKDKKEKGEQYNSLFFAVNYFILKNKYSVNCKTTLETDLITELSDCLLCRKE